MSHTQPAEALVGMHRGIRWVYVKYLHLHFTMSNVRSVYLKQVAATMMNGSTNRLCGAYRCLSVSLFPYVIKLPTEVVL
jgi:hypothetical protein